jgi:lysozyme
VQLFRFISEHLTQATKKSNMNISKEGLALIKKFEGCKLEAYKCAAEVWTIGYGSTKGVKEGDTITQEEAEELLIKDVKVFEKAVNDAVERSMVQCQFDALVSWTFNLGAGSLNSSTMLKKLNNQEYDEVVPQMKRWNKAGGKVLQGLIRRREAEALLYEGKEWHEV